MGFLSKIKRGVKKFSSFTGKVAKGVAKGGLTGGIAAGVVNLGGGKKSKTKTKNHSTKLGDASPKSVADFGGVVLTTKEEQRKKIMLWVGGAIAFVIAIIFVFKRKK